MDTRVCAQKQMTFKVERHEVDSSRRKDTTVYGQFLDIHVDWSSAEVGVTGNPQILLLIPLPKICNFLWWARLQIANLPILYD
jgi:hypothetical protein